MAARRKKSVRRKKAARKKRTTRKAATVARPATKASAAALRASAVVKRHAKKQRVRVRVSAAQMKALKRQWADVDGALPAEVVFVVGRTMQSRFRVAAYGYYSTTCCA